MIRTVLCLCATAALVAADAGAMPADLLQRVLEAQRFTRMAGTFTQRTAPVAEPDAPTKTFTVRFALEMPDRYDLVYTQPGDQDWMLRLCSDGERRWKIERIIVGMDPDVIVEPVRPADGGAGDGGAAAGPGGEDAVVRRITELLRLDPVAIARDFTVAGARRDDGWRLELTPKQASLAEHVRRIEVDLGADLRTRALRFDDQRGNRVAIVVEEAVYDPQLPAGTFAGPEP